MDIPTEEIGMSRFGEHQGDAPGNGQDLLVGKAEDLAHLPHSGPGLERHVVSHHGRPLAAVLFEDVGQHAVPFVPGEVHVDVGQVGALLVQKPFEGEVVAQGVDLGNEQAVAHDGGGAAAPADGEALLAHDVGHHQEIGREPLAADQVQLLFDAGYYLGGQGLPLWA
ncbi:hypothetical protein ES703_65490 [subsurface metagenome]